MPFDGSPRVGATTQEDPAIRALDEILMVLGPNGEHWGRGEMYNSVTRQYCIYGAASLGIGLISLHRDTSVFVDVVKALSNRIPSRYKLPLPSTDSQRVWFFNDNARSFSEIRAWIERAREERMQTRKKEEKIYA